MLKAPTLVDRANDLISIIGLLRSLDVHVPDIGVTKSYRTYCPFGILHPDHGMDKALRIYPETNSAFCFAGCGYFTPVGLAMMAWDLTPAEAAQKLLDDAGSSVVPEPYQAPPEPLPDRYSLEEALRVYARRKYPGWEADHHFRETFERCLSLLKMVRVSTQAEEWMLGCKQALDRLVPLEAPL
jgi:hypothetical protein